MKPDHDAGSMGFRSHEDVLAYQRSMTTTPTTAEPLTPWPNAEEYERFCRHAICVIMGFSDEVERTAAWIGWSARAHLATQASAPNPWRQAVDRELVAAGLDCLAPDAEATPSLARLLSWRCTIALDPAVSEEAQALIERGRASAPQVVEPSDSWRDVGMAIDQALRDGVDARLILDENSPVRDELRRLVEAGAPPFRERCQYPKACRASDPRGCNVFTCGGVVAQASALLSRWPAQQPAVERARALFEEMGCIADDERCIAILAAALASPTAQPATSQQTKDLGVSPPSSGPGSSLQPPSSASAAIPDATGNVRSGE